MKRKKVQSFQADERRAERLEPIDILGPVVDARQNGVAKAESRSGLVETGQIGQDRLQRHAGQLLVRFRIEQLDVVEEEIGSVPPIVGTGSDGLPRSL